MSDRAVDYLDFQHVFSAFKNNPSAADFAKKRSTLRSGCIPLVLENYNMAHIRLAPPPQPRYNPARCSEVMQGEK
jgi:hypothetical protein